MGFNGFNDNGFGWIIILIVLFFLFAGFED